MQIDKISNQNFGKCYIHKSASKLLDKIPNKRLTEISALSDCFENTKFWDMYIKSNYTKDAFVVYFINKTNPLERSFLSDLFPFQQYGNKIETVAPDANPVKGNQIYHLEFETKKRASEVYKFLNKHKPQNGEKIFDREFKILNILEEAYEYMNLPKPTEQKDLSLCEKFIKILGL